VLSNSSRKIKLGILAAQNQAYCKVRSHRGDSGRKIKLDTLVAQNQACHNLGKSRHTTSVYYAGSAKSSLLLKRCSCRKIKLGY
jgi:hypothetical protein